jgi:hypothetical protein
MISYVRNDDEAQKKGKRSEDREIEIEKGSFKFQNLVYFIKSIH